MKNIREYVSNNIKEIYRIIYDLCKLPAPSHHEEHRAESRRRAVGIGYEISPWRFAAHVKVR